MEWTAGEKLALRLGFRQIDGFRQTWGEAIEAARASGPFASIEDLARRAALPPAALRKLADADAFGSLGKGRRDALWEARRTPSDQLPLFAFADAAELDRLATRSGGVTRIADPWGTEIVLTRKAA